MFKHAHKTLAYAQVLATCVLMGIAFFGPASRAVAEGLVGGGSQAVLHAISGSRDPIAFTQSLSPSLAPMPVPLSQQEAVTAEILLHSRSLPRAEALLTAQALCQEAQAAGMDPLLLVAVISVESNFNHLAISGVGAEGLMQLMPGTAEYLAARGRLPWPDQQSFDPVLNVRLGVRYLATLRDMFDGHLDEALTAYNRGPKATRMALRGRRSLPTSVRASYAGRVMTAYQILRGSYGHLPPT